MSRPFSSTGFSLYEFDFICLMKVATPRAEACVTENQNNLFGQAKIGESGQSGEPAARGLGKLNKFSAPQQLLRLVGRTSHTQENHHCQNQDTNR